MDLKPRDVLTEEEVKKGLKLVIADGLAAEAMTTFTSGAFLVAMALLVGASNFQIGLLAALPMFTNLFQLISIWLVRRYNNRRAVTVVSSLLARVPLIIIGSAAFFVPQAAGIDLLLIFLFFYYLFRFNCRTELEFVDEGSGSGKKRWGLISENAQVTRKV
jgi:hypothetical protein